MFFQNIKEFILNNKKSLLFLSFLILALFPELSFAAETTKDDGTGTILSAINSFIGIAGMLLGLSTQFVGLFLTPEWSSGSAIGFGDHLKELWILVSNIVYTIFAFLLIWIAFMNIIGKGQNTWELKTALPKFIGGVLIVPFTWLIISGMISLSGILTTTVLTIPSSTFPDLYTTGINDTVLSKVKVCEEYTFDPKTTVDSSVSQNPLTCTGKEKTLVELMKDDNGFYGIMSTYTYGLMEVDTQGSLTALNLNSIKSIGDLTAKVIFDLLFMIIFFILLIAILLALFVRGIYLWIFTVLSPVFGLMFFFGDKTPKSLEDFGFSKFLGLVLMPVYVAAALSFGLLFIFVAGQNINKGIEECTNDKHNICVNQKGDNPAVKILGINIVFNFDMKGGSEDPRDIFAKFILQIFGLTVLWIAVMAALGSTSITEKVVAPIKSFGDSVGKLAAAAPTYAPIIPTGNGMMTATGLGQAASVLKGDIDSHFQSKGQKIGHAMNPFGGGEVLQELRTLNNGFSSLDKNLQADRLKKAISMGNKEYQGDINKQKELKTMLGNIKGLTEDGKKNIENINFNNADDFAKGINTVVHNSQLSSEEGLENYTNIKNTIANGKVTKPEDLSAKPKNNSTTNNNITLKTYNSNLKSAVETDKTEAIKGISDSIKSDEVKKFEDVNELSESIKVKMENDTKYKADLSPTEIKEIADKVAENIKNDFSKKFKDES